MALARSRGLELTKVRRRVESRYLGRCRNSTCSSSSSSGSTTRNATAVADVLANMPASSPRPLPSTAGLVSGGVSRAQECGRSPRMSLPNESFGEPYLFLVA